MDRWTDGEWTDGEYLINNYSLGLLDNSDSFDLQRLSDLTNSNHICFGDST